MATINFTPLYGVQSETSCCCYLLEIDEVCILLDCGWTEEFDVELIQPLRRVIPRVDLVLISHLDLAHLGALPYAVGKLGLEAPIYGTLPVHRMGQIAMYDAFQAQVRNTNFDLFDLDDIDAVFENFKQLKYSEKLTLTSSGEGIVITPHSAGHLIGGSLWKISKETEEIIYAVDYNHRSEHVLSKTVLDSFRRPTVMITGSMNLQREQPKLKDRDKQIMNVIMNTIRDGGNVLIPCDSSGRVLELMRVLDQYWLQHKLRDPVVLLHDMSYYVSKAAQAMLEWCNERISKNFDIGRQNPFQFMHINLLHSMEELDKLQSPKVVITTSQTLEFGYSRELFVRWASDEKNHIIFTSIPEIGTLGHTVLSKNHPVGLNIKCSQKVPLTGVELAMHEARERRRIQAEAEAKAKEEEEAEMEHMILGIEDYESSDSDSQQDSSQVQLRGSFRVGFGQFATSKYPMFHIVERRSEWDEYGEIIKPEDYMDSSSRSNSMNRNASKLMMMEVDSDKPVMEEESNSEKIDSRPTKTIIKEIHVEINARITSIDFEGLADGRAIKNCVSSVMPRKLILVHGSLDATNKLKEFVEKNISYCEAVFTPKALECIDIVSDTNVYKLNLKETLYSSISFTKVGAHEVGYVSGRIDFSEASHVPIMENICVPEENTLQDPSDIRYPAGHDPVLLSEGAVKLDVLKQMLTKAGFQTDFHGGVLVCDGSVIIKRTRKNEMVVEGVLSEKYYKIQNILRNQFSLV